MMGHSASAMSRQTEPSGWASAVLHWSCAGLVSASWISAGMFAIFIFAFYLGAIPSHHMEWWNSTLPGLYRKGDFISVLAMGAHLATGAVILLFGPVQLIGSLRRRRPGLHRWMGRVYVFTAAVAGIGGLGFIVSKGTVGGAVMNAGFGLYGALMTLAAFQAYRHARAGRFEQHRAWAIRLFALAIGSWLYRMDYGFWLTAAHRLGHTGTFRGPFDIVMSFFFYIPNLIVAEMFIRSRRGPSHPAIRISAAVAVNLATCVVLLATYYFGRSYWGPGIVSGLTAGAR
jgi:hypothetical protein